MEGRNAPCKDCLSSAVLLLIGGGYLWYDLRYSLETLENPGPGVFPLAVGVLLVGLSATQLVTVGRYLRRRATPGTTEGRLDASPTHGRNRATREPAPWTMVGALILYLLVVSWLGFLTCTFVLVIVCSKLMGARGWGRAVTLAGGVVLVCYFLFSVWLRVPLPTGYLL